MSKEQKVQCYKIEREFLGKASAADLLGNIIKSHSSANSRENHLSTPDNSDILSLGVAVER